MFASPEKNLAVEQKENVEFKEVVRVFLLQPIAPETIASDSDLENCNLNRLILIQKNDQSNNPNQIMPIGGNVELGEDSMQAARREVLEETHLIIDLEQLQTTQTYEFIHHGIKAGRKSVFFLGKLFAPKYDAPYPLDNKVDKISGFAYLNLQDLQHLFSEGTFGSGNILDSLNKDETEREKVQTVANTNEIIQLQNELITESKYAEIKSKVHIFETVLRIGFGAVDENLRNEITLLIKGFEQLSAKKDDTSVEMLFEKVQTFWKQNIVTISGGYKNIQSALRFLSVENVLSDLGIDPTKKIQNGKGFPTAHIMFSVMFGFDFDKKLIPLLEGNSHIDTLYKMSKVLYLYNEYLYGENENRRGASSRLLKRILKINKTGGFNEEDIFTFFKQEMYINTETQESFRFLGDEIDAFFSDLQNQTKVPPSLAYLAHKNEVQDKSFERIIKLAFSDAESITDKQIKFEAQRKLLLAHMLIEVKKYYEDIKKKGIEPLDDLEAELEIKDNSLQPLQKKNRTIMLQDKSFKVIIERNPKEMRSLLRKVLVRDEWNFTEKGPYNDIYRETYVFDVDANEDMVEEKRITPCIMTDGKGGTIETYKAPLVVHNFISELVKKAETKGDNLEVHLFKGLPKNGEGMVSSGVGGGGKIRLCKFYIKHRDDENIERMREVQIFLPKEEGGAWVSGEKDYNHKKEDDERYTLQRLFTHGNAYSLIELLFPYHIYGDRMKVMFEPNNKF